MQLCEKAINLFTQQQTRVKLKLYRTGAKRMLGTQCSSTLPGIATSQSPTRHAGHLARRLRKRQLTDQQGRLMLKNFPMNELEQWCSDTGQRSLHSITGLEQHEKDLPRSDIDENLAAAQSGASQYCFPKLLGLL